jgi:hypothetical protein
MTNLNTTNSEDTVRVELGEFGITAALTDIGNEVWCEDGYIWQPYMVWSLQASHKDGKIYGGGFYDTKKEAMQALATIVMTEDWTPTADENWCYLRTIYGSPAWGMEDEIGMMDDEERYHKGL